MFRGLLGIETRQKHVDTMAWHSMASIKHTRRLQAESLGYIPVHITGVEPSESACQMFISGAWWIYASDSEIHIRETFILGSMVSHYRVIIDLSQSAPAVGWGSPLHAWLASVNWISSACCLNRRYRYGARGMHYHILLRQYRQNCYTYNSVVKNTYSPCHKHACVQISIGNTEWLLCYKGVS